MIIDLTHTFELVTQRNWSREQATKLLSMLASSADGGTSDWDEGAGEFWGRCIKGGEVLAYVCIERPLVFLHEGWDRPSSQAAAHATLVPVPSMAVPCLGVSHELLEKFAGRTVSGQLKGNFLSVEDLVWLTI